MANMHKTPARGVGLRRTVCVNPYSTECLVYFLQHIRYVYYNRVSTDQHHIRMCHMAVAQTSNVTYVCTIGLRGLMTSLNLPEISVIRFVFVNTRYKPVR